MLTENGLSKSQIRNELDKVLLSAGFAKSPILSRFLKFVVEKSLDGRSDQIKEYTVGTSVLNKPPTFNPQLDASVRIHAIRLRKLLEEYYQENKPATIYRFDLPKGSYCPTFTLEEHLLHTHLSKGQNNHHPLPVTIPEDSICVVPFNGYIPSGSLDISIDGFCGFLSQRLSLFQDISVKSYYSTTRYFAEGGELKLLGDALDVTYYLTGSMDVGTSGIQVSVRLFEAKSDTLIWSQEFSAQTKDHSLSNIIHDIADRIVASLAGYSGVIHYRKFAMNENIPALSNAQATAVFWFYHYLTHQNESRFGEAVKHLESSVREDPTASLCWSVLAQIYTDSIFYNYQTGSKNPLETAQSYVERALDLNPECQHGNLTVGWINIFLKNKVVAVQSIEKALVINPNASFFVAASSLGMALLGEYERSMQLLERALPMNPLPYWWLTVPPILNALKMKDYKKMLFHARKMGTPAGIQEYIFVMVALYYLEEEFLLKHQLRLYLQKHPDGIEQAINAWPKIIYDEDVGKSISVALQEILNLKGSITT